MISKLTPKTWQVRDAYTRGVKSRWTSEDKAHFKFTKWLLKEQRRSRKIGKAQERNRIIALLEEHRAVGYEQEMTHDKLIALIKGENE